VRKPGKSGFHERERRTTGIISSRAITDACVPRATHDPAIPEYCRRQASLLIASAFEARRSCSEATMTNMFKALGLAAILSATTAPAISAQAIFHGPVVIASNETATRPWSAPVGHRQPRAADLPASLSAAQQSLDPEDAEVDRKIKGVCRGC
jgi:hypothetical protein